RDADGIIVIAQRSVMFDTVRKKRVLKQYGTGREQGRFPSTTRRPRRFETGGWKMRYGLIALWMLVWSVTSAIAQVSVGIGLPGVSIGINLPAYPELVRVPDYPVYYAPRLGSNYFFYDGMYWVFQGDNWYASSWYNGPWALVAPQSVPLF